jgi:hypothetical protein
VLNWTCFLGLAAAPDVRCLTSAVAMAAGLV